MTLTLNFDLPTDPCFHYTTNVAARRLHLPWWAEPFAVGLLDLLLDVPFDILGIKYLWWVWHDTDPNIFDRTYSVPLTRCASIRILCHLYCMQQAIFV